MEHDCVGGGSVMVWTGIDHDGCTALSALSAQIYRTEKLQQHLIPLVEARCSSVVRAFAHGAMGRRIDPSWWTH